MVETVALAAKVEDRKRFRACHLRFEAESSKDLVAETIAVDIPNTIMSYGFRSSMRRHWIGLECWSCV